MSTSLRTRTHARTAGDASIAGHAPPANEYGTMPTPKELRYFEPTAATASMFLYAQGASIVCCHHDTLTIERRFSKHSDEVQLLAVDNQSEKGGGRLVVSYDAGQTAIIWDLMTGDEISRFASFEDLTVASWMRSGNVAFGNTQGNIIMFEPTTSEHISTRTIDQIAITALAPSADCRTFAIGYQNGSLLIATLQPRFTILHQLSTPSRLPSPVVTLSWHASSSRSRSDMLAVQAHDGDLRVWSVAKSSSSDDGAKIVRLLKRADDLTKGANWMGWSKNGRIIQFTDSQTHSWDVRTKHVTCDSIPTLEHVKGLAVYGPGATLFTLGPNGTVQQFDLNSPSIMVANVQHPVNPLPPSPPNSIEEPGVKSAHSVTTINTSASESELSSIPVGEMVSESDEDHLSPFQRITRHNAMSAGTDSANEIIRSPASSRSGLSSLSQSSAGSGTPRRHPASAASRGLSDYTYISAGSSIRTSTVGRRDLDNVSMGYTLPSTSFTSTSFATQSSARSRQRPSRLRNEIPRSPDENKVHDLFMYTRARLTDIPYKHPANSDFSRLTNDDLRRQMLSTIFGWHKEVDDLIRDEMSRHPGGSTSRILLAKWLGDIDADAMVADSKNMSSSDWMLLALSGIGGHASQHKLGRTYVSRLLESGDIHAAVTIMLGMGDFNDAIEAYMAHKRYMEALILTCLEFPSVWERQAAIVRKWGEWAVQHNRQQLAIRCFACTDMESTEPWTSPSAQQLNFQNITASIPEILSPPLSPPGVQRGPQRSIAKSSALKLITSFGDQNKKSKFYSQADGGQTPLAAGVTPIAESAVSPGGFEAATAFLRPSNNSRFNTPTSASMGPRGRLPSIGEIPSDLNRDALRSEASRGSEHRRGHNRRASHGQDNLTEGLNLQRAATASPMMMRDQPTRIRAATHGEIPPPPDKNVMAKMQKGDFAQRNGSRDRMPRGLHLNLVPDDDAEIVSPEQSVSSSTRFHWPTRRRGPGSVSSSVTSSSAGRSLRGRVRHPDDYIHSLDAASSFKTARKAHSSRERTTGGRQASRERRGAKSRENSEDRGRSSARMWHKPKRSPTSPVPMSPEDIANLSNPIFAEPSEPRTVRKSSVVKRKTGSRTSSRGSRRQSPDARPAPLDLRGRSKDRDRGARQRSPSSPLPMSATAMHYTGSEDDEDFKMAMQAQEEFRAKHSRSATRGLNSPVVTKMEHSQVRQKEVAEALERLPSLPPAQPRTASTDQAGDLRRIKEERLRKKEQAARELEERRQSLAQRGLATPIPPPNQGVQTFPRLGVETSNPANSADVPPRSATSSPPRSMYARGGPHLGLPATPKAMRLIIEGDPNARVSQAMPEVPSIPAQYVQQPSTTQQQVDQEGPEAPSAEPELLTLLPSTVYQPPVRPPPRSMSAPIPDDLGKGRNRRKSSTGEIKPIKEKLSDSEMMPPPPPPAPPMLKELQHLAIPPPPPPAPLPNAQRAPQNAALSSGMIEIVMDEEDGLTPAGIAAPNDNMVPVLSSPAPPHTRGRSIGDATSIASTFAKAKDRLRSGSQGRKEPARHMGKESPYESVPTTQLQPTIRSPPPVMYDQEALRTPIVLDSKHSKHMSTGLHRSEMI